ncbi:MAG: radical SAM protein [bacterium]|nr:radical SAM protein [bacterium]
MDGRLPLYLSVETTSVCNARCIFCAYPDMKRPKQIMTPEAFEDVIEQYVAMGGGSVNLTPIVGDPLIDPHFHQRLEVLGRYPQITEVVFFTNAIELKADKIKAIIECGNWLRTTISIAGTTRETYADLMGVDKFDRVRANTLSFLETNLANGNPHPIGVVFRSPHGPETLAKDPSPFLHEVNAYAEKGACQIFFHEEMDTWSGDIPAERLTSRGFVIRKPTHRSAPCALLYYMPTVLADGRVNACACRDVEATLIIGDVKSESLEAIWNGQALREIRDAHWRGDFPDVCQTCDAYVPLDEKLADEPGPRGNWARLPET